MADTLTDESRKREMGAFALAAPYLNGSRVLLTLDDEAGMVSHDGVEISRRNLLSWVNEG